MFVQLHPDGLIFSRYGNLSAKDFIRRAAESGRQNTQLRLTHRKGK